MGEVRLGIRRTHSEQIMKSIDYLLRNSGMGLDDIDCYTIAIGPGSFTGLRVGLSTVKGLAYAGNKPVVAVSTLEALASVFPCTGMLICPLLDARKKEVYGALFRRTGKGLEKIVPESATDIRALLSRIEGETLFVGSGAALYRDVITECLGKRAFFPLENLMHPMPSALAVLGLQKAEKGGFSDPMTLAPLYLRKSEAEIKMKPPADTD